MLAATPIGVEFAVNTATAGDQESGSARSVATDDAGNFVVVWTSFGQDGSGTGVYAQRFDSSGNALGAEFRINQATFGNQVGPVITMNSQGDFVVAWGSEGQDGSGYGVYMRRYDSTGTALGNETRVNTFAIGNQFEVAAAINDSGNFVVTWTSNGQDGNGDGVFGQRYSSTGAAVGSEFRVNTVTVGQQSTSAVTMNALGEFTVTWHSFGTDGSGFGVYAQRYTAAGARNGSNTLVNTTTSGDQFSPEITSNSSGDYIIAWLSTGAATGVFAQRYTSGGTKVGSEFRLDSPELPASTTFVPSIAMRDDGSFFAVWTMDGGANGLEVVGRDFLSDGTPFDAPEVLNTFLASDQWGPTVAVDAFGNSIVAWTSFSQDGSGDGVFAQRFGLPSQSNNDFTIPENSAAGTFVGAVADDGGLTAPLTYYFTAGNDAGAFVIDASTGVITVANATPLDFETQPVFTLTVAIVDANNQAQLQTVYVRLSDVDETGTNSPPTIALTNRVTTLPQSTDTTNPVRVADIVVSDDGIGTNTLTLTGLDADLFQIIGSQLFLRAGTVLDGSSNPRLDATVNVDDSTVGTTPDDTASLVILVTGGTQNVPPAISLSNAVVSIPENTSTANRIFVANINVTDDGVGTNQLSLTGTDASSFEIIGNQLFLRAGTTLDATNDPTFDVTVNVDDATVGSTPDDSVAYTLRVTAVNNTAPTITLANAVISIPENTDTTNRIKVADIVVNDDGQGVNQLSLTGTNAGVFEIIGTQLFLRAGTVLNRQSNPQYVTTVNVDDSSIGGTPDDSVTYQLNITAVTNTPPSIQLSNATVSLPENTDTTFDIKVADVVIFDDGLGNNQITLIGADANSFVVVGTELFVRAGTQLNRNTNPSLDVTVQVDDSTVGGSPDDSVNYSINITASTNQSPSISGFDDSTTFTGNGEPVLVGQNAGVRDDDSSDFDGGWMTVGFSDYSNSNDQLAVRSGSTGGTTFAATSTSSGPITTSGDQVLWNGVSIGTFSGGQGSTPLTFQFNANATPLAVQDLIRAVTYANLAAKPTTADRALQVVLNDGDGGTSDAVFKSVAVSSTSTNPVIGNLGTSPTFTEGQAPVTFTTSGTLTDADSADFDTGTMTFQTVTNGQAEDVMTIRHQGFGAGQIGVQGSMLYYGGASIGSFAGGEGATPLTVRFNSQADAAAAQAVMRNVTFANTSGNPSSLARNIQMTMSDGHGGSTTVTRSIFVKPVNTPPEIVITQNPVTYSENDAATLIDDEIEVHDVDSINFAGGKLTMTMTSPTSGATAADRIQIRIEGTGPGLISVSGTSVSYGGTVIGTFSGGSGSPMNVTFNAQATAAAVQALMRNMTYLVAGENPSGAPRSMNIVLTDGDGGTSLTATKTVVMTPVNDAPTIGGFTTSANYRKNGPAVSVGTSSTVVDFDSTNFDGGVMTVSLSANGEAADRLAIQNQGRMAGQIGVSGSSITFGGKIIGTFSGGQGTTPLEIRFNSAATPAAAQALLRMILFSSASPNPSPLARTLEVTVSDGDGDTSLAVSKTINVMFASPVIAGWDTVATYKENATPTVLDTNATVTDADSANFAGGTLTLELTANGTADDQLSVRNQGSGVNQIGVIGSTVTFGGVAIGTMTGGLGSPLVIQLNAGATPISMQALVRNLTFANVSDAPSTAQRTVQLTLTDDDGRMSQAVSKKVTVTAVNDGPVIAGLGGTSATYRTGNGPVNIGLGSQVTDIDSPDFYQGRLTVRLSANAATTDRLSIQNQGSGAGQVGVSGSNVTYGGTVVGTFSGGSGTTPLTIVFNAKATAEAASAILGALLFDSIATTPTTATRTLQFTLTDGDGGTSPTYFSTVSMSS